MALPLAPSFKSVKAGYQAPPDGGRAGKAPWPDLVVSGPGHAGRQHEGLWSPSPRAAGKAPLTLPTGELDPGPRTQEHTRPRLTPATGAAGTYLRQDR